MDLLTMLLLNKLKNSGGGSIPSEIIQKDVNFYDYDGTLVNSYTKSEFLQLTEMPANPSHKGLVAEGWNWTLSDAKTYVETYGKLIIGQNYNTESEKCEFDIELIPSIGKAIGLNVEGTKDWGDGTVNTATTHTYADYGNYTIKCECSILPAYIFSQSSTADYSLKHLRLTNVELQGNCLKSCRSLETISLSTTVTIGSGSSQLEDCIRLKALILPAGTISIPNRFLYTNANLDIVSLSKDITSLGEATFRNAYRIKNISIPAGVTQFNNELFRNCTSLEEIIFPAGFTSINSNNTLNYCINLDKMDFRNATSVPSLPSASILSYVNVSCKIIVPDDLYSTWKTTSYWNSVSSQIIKASDYEG